MSVTYKWKFPKIPLFDGKKATEIMKGETDQFIKTVLSIYQTNIIKESPVGATGYLRNNILQYQTSFRSGYVVANAKYSIVIEKGRSASPIARSADPSIRAWITRSTQGQAYYASLKATYPKITIEQALFLLKRKKRTTPTKPNKFFTRGVEKSKMESRSVWNNYKKTLAQRTFGK